MSKEASMMNSNSRGYLISLTYLMDTAEEGEERLEGGGSFEPGEIILEAEAVYAPILRRVSVLSSDEIGCLQYVDGKWFKQDSHFLRTMTIVHYLLAVQHGKYIEKRWEHIALTYQLTLKFWSDEIETGYTDFMKITRYNRFPPFRKCWHTHCKFRADYGKAIDQPLVCKFHFEQKEHEYKKVRPQESCPYFHIYVACYRKLQWKLFGHSLKCQMRYFAS